MLQVFRATYISNSRLESALGFTPGLRLSSLDLLMGHPGWGGAWVFSKSV